MNDIESLAKSRNDLVTALLKRIRSRHAPRIDERLVRDHETWLDAGVALRLLRPGLEPDQEGEA